MPNSMFTINEMIVIHSALEEQIEATTDLLNDPGFSLEDKAQMAEILKYSQSAFDRMTRILKKEGCLPDEN